MERRQRFSSPAAPIFLRGTLVGLGNEGRVVLALPALGIHPGRRPGSPSFTHFPPVRSVRNNPPCGVPGEVPGGCWDDGSHFSEWRLSVAFPSVLEERHSACLGNRRQHLSHWRRL